MVWPWRKRNEGFEWRTYVRTTILVRRHERRQRADDVKAAAVFGVKQAGQKGISAAGAGLKSAGDGSLSALRWMGRRARLGARHSANAIAGAARRAAAGTQSRWKSGCSKSRTVLAPKLAAAGSYASAMASSAAAKAALKLEPAVAPLRHPGPQLALKLIAAVGTGGALIRAWQFGFDSHAVVALAMGGGALCLLLIAGLAEGRWIDRWLATGVGRGLARLGAAIKVPIWISQFARRGRILAALGVVTLGVVTLGIMGLTGAGDGLWQRGSTTIQGLSGAPKVASPTAAEPAVMTGSASAISGDTLRISGTSVSLDGIEAPDRTQICSKPTIRRWDCGAAAREALSRLVRGNRVSCEITSGGGTAARAGRCLTGGTDLAAVLVRNGHVFALSGLFAPYSALESEAKNLKAGLWAGDAVRPSAWRASRWEEAKSKAPDGCPIKGQVFRRSGKVYVLPWSPDYDRARIDKAHGERWFCSESEAVSAGWKPF